MGVAAMPDAAPVVEYVAPTASAVERPSFDIGKTLDDPTDMARLMIVTQYAGSKTVNVYASTGTESVAVSGVLLSDGRIQTAGDDSPTDEADDTFVTLKPVGMYYLGLDGAVLLGDGSESVAATAKPVQVFSYSGTGRADNDNDDVSGYAVYRQDTTTAAGVTMISYAAADITFTINRDGDAATGDDAGNEEVAVTAKIPEATDCKHIHFGVWAALGDPE